MIFSCFEYSLARIKVCASFFAPLFYREAL